MANCVKKISENFVKKILNYTYTVYYDMESLVGFPLTRKYVTLNDLE